LKPAEFNFQKGRTPASEQNESTAEVKPTVTCKSESKGEILESDVKN